MARSKLLLEAHLKALRLPTFLREYDKLARQCAAESLDSRSFLQQLCELSRENATIWIANSYSPPASRWRRCAFEWRPQ